MRKHILTTVALLPLLLSLSTAEQNWTFDSAQPFAIPSEDSGTSSYLGVDIVDISSDRLGTLKLKEEQRMLPPAKRASRSTTSFSP